MAGLREGQSLESLMGDAGLIVQQADNQDGSVSAFMLYAIARQLDAMREEMQKTRSVLRDMQHNLRDLR